jgi:hypothetical protein
MENNYKITPLTVEISVLKIGKKQCTIAVFKQLKEERIIPEMIDEIEIWGEVYYSQHWYIIYAYNKEIYKTIKPYLDIKYWYFFQRYTLADLPKLIIPKEWENHIEYSNFKLLVDWINDNPENSKISMFEIFTSKRSSFPNNFTDYIRESQCSEELDNYRLQLYKLKYINCDYFYDIIDRFLIMRNDSIVILESKVDQFKLECECIDKYNVMINSLDNLPQLFIAV